MMDAQLHIERIAPDRSKRVFIANIDELPDGVFVNIDATVGDPWLNTRATTFSPGRWEDTRDDGLARVRR